ncbi:MAG: hypothetical protein JWN03_7203 [Nocardia sp.]|nr:hypothetical protein [Nocardia sp.]
MAEILIRANDSWYDLIAQRVSNCAMCGRNIAQLGLAIVRVIVDQRLYTDRARNSQFINQTVQMINRRDRCLSDLSRPLVVQITMMPQFVMIGYKRLILVRHMNDLNFNTRHRGHGSNVSLTTTRDIPSDGNIAVCHGAAHGGYHRMIRGVR